MRLVLILFLTTNLSYGQRVYDLVDSIQISDYLSNGVVQASESIQLYSNGKAEKQQKKWEFELDSNRFIYREFKNNTISREDICVIDDDFHILKDSIYSGNKKPFEYVVREWKRDYLLQEIHYLPSGAIRSELRQSFNSKGHLKSFVKLNQKDTISYSYKYHYDSLDRIKVKTKLNKEGKLVETLLFEYIEEGKTLNVFKLSELNGKVPVETKSYNGEGKLTMNVIYKNGKELYKILYHYSNNSLVSEEVFNVSENYTFFHNYRYSKKGKLLEANGKFELEDAFDYQVKYKYKKSRLKKESYFNRDGSLKKEIVYHYDKCGSIIKKVVYQGKKPLYQYQYSVNYK